MPPRSTRVKTLLGEGKVIDYQILAQLVVVELDNGTKTTVPREELEIISQPQIDNAQDESAPDKDAEDANNNGQTNA
jgi:hypothetical protein